MATETNIQTSGVSDADTGAVMRHDPLADLLILRAVDSYLATGADDSGVRKLACRLSPIVASEFANYGVDRAWIYVTLIDLSRVDSDGPWLADARRYAELLSRSYIDPETGAERNPGHATYRSDYAAEASAALADAGRRFGRPDWILQSRIAALYLVAHAADLRTGLFPASLQVDATQPRDHVTDPLVKAGSQAQLLDGLLSVYDVTHEAALLNAVNRAVASLESAAVGLADRAHGGYFYAVDADGTGVRTRYKETRQAWMLPLWRHIQQDTGLGQARVAELEGLVRDDLFRSVGEGYAYRVEPNFSSYVSTIEGVRMREDWISSEANGIALYALIGDLS